MESGLEGERYDLERLGRMRSNIRELKTECLAGKRAMIVPKP